MPQELVQLNTRKPVLRVTMVVFLLAAAGLSYLALSWYAGNTLAENFVGDERDLDVGRFATTLSPNDPLTHWRVGLMWEKGQPVSGLGQAIPEYERAVSLSPNDYRFWIALGIAHERAGDPAKGEHAMRQAISLAPSYAIPRWYLGNLLVRNGKYDEAFDELRRASEANAELIPQMYNLIWGVYGADYDSISRALNNRADARGNFSFYLLSRGKFDEGLHVWSGLTPAEKSDYKSIGDALVSTLIKNNRFYDAMNVWNDVAPHPSSRAIIDRIVDGSFEDVNNAGPEMAFNWQVKSRQIQIDIDPNNGHSGRRSMRILFQVRSRLEPVIATNLIPISPDTHYDLEFYVKSQKLQSGATPFIQVMSAADNVALAQSPQAPNGDKDWVHVSVPFKTPPKIEAVVVQIARGSCADTEVCPIFGTLWYDDFSLKRRN
jgi:Tetratricopeptide repeat